MILPLIGSRSADPLGRGVFVTGVYELAQQVKALSERREEGVVGDDAERGERVVPTPLPKGDRNVTNSHIC